jgi:hypothetical protein
VQRLEEHALAEEGNNPSKEAQAHRGAEETTILALKPSKVIALKFDKGRDKRRLEECIPSKEADERNLITLTSSCTHGIEHEPVEEEVNRKQVPRTQDIVFSKTPADMLMSVDPWRKKPKLEEELSLPVRDKKDFGIQERINLKALANMPVSVDQHRQEKNLPHLSVRKVRGNPVYPKHDLKINWKFLLLLSATLLCFVSAGDCPVMNNWLPDMFSATGTECCSQTGITCVSDRITEMYFLKLILL